LAIDNSQIDLLEKELLKYKRQTQLLVVKLRRERHKVRRLQPIVSRLVDLDNIAMDGPIPTSSRWKKRKNDNHRFHGLIHAVINLVIQEDHNFCRWKES
jgi:hypothetical protein